MKLAPLWWSPPVYLHASPMPLCDWRSISWRSLLTRISSLVVLSQLASDVVAYQGRWAPGLERHAEPVGATDHEREDGADDQEHSRNLPAEVGVVVVVKARAARTCATAHEA